MGEILLLHHAIDALRDLAAAGTLQLNREFLDAGDNLRLSAT
ncbi:hypothetical protein ACIGXA_10910 [Streptomyces fildesensis]|uniref:Uncharacterized protein n=1 Tax=Streptomyces fildesensis TaxID=375757 RepID=A0ABW8C3N1_9ACTN